MECAISESSPSGPNRPAMPHMICGVCPNHFKAREVIPSNHVYRTMVIAKATIENK